MRPTLLIASIAIVGAVLGESALAQDAAPEPGPSAETRPASATPATPAPSPASAAAEPAAKAETPADGRPAAAAGEAKPAGTARGDETAAPVVTFPAEDPIGVLVARRAAEIVGRTGNREDLAAITSYFQANPDKPIWLQDNAFSARARKAMAEIRRADDWGLAASEFPLPALKPDPDRAALADAEARLSLAVLKYARHARGGRLVPTQLTENFDRQPPLANPRRVLDELAATEAADVYLRRLHPQHPQFERLRQLYLALRAGKTVAAPEAAEPPPPPPESGRGRGKGRAAAPPPPPPPEAITLRRVLVNMEMWRWMPRDLGTLHVEVNIPEYEVRVVRSGQVIHAERVIVGEVGKQTPLLTQDMQSIVYHPGWGVPNSIKVNDLLPGLLAGRDSLGRNGLVASYRGRPIDHMSIDWRTTDIRSVDVIQPPGPRNVLGLVKFQFPNKHDVYMHDTPTKDLFNATQRTFSHGCIRVRNPVRLAEIIMAEAAGWQPQRVASVLQSGPMENRVALTRRVPVHLVYFTVWVDDAGKAVSFRDVYSHEQKVQLGLEGKAHLIPRVRQDLSAARADAVRRADSQGWSPGWGYGGGYSRDRGPGDWMRNVFGGF